MKQLFAIIIASFVFASATAQKFQTDFSYSTTKQTGMNIYHVGSKGFIIGVGGSYMFSTYTGETGRKFQELANVSLGNDGNRLSLAFRNNYIYDNFVEDRGTAKFLIGKSFGKTSVYATAGLSFRSEYWKGKGYDFLPSFTSPERYFYIYKNISPKALFGVHANHMISNRLGVNVGYDNIQKFSIGVTVNLKGSGIFEW